MTRVLQLRRLLGAAAFVLGLAGCGSDVHPAKAIDPAVVRAAHERTVVIHFTSSDYPKGSGLLIDDQGTVLTCAHVIFGWETRLRVSVDGATFHPARLIRKDDLNDLAILATPLRKKVAPHRWARPRSLELNEDLFLFGAPYGLVGSLLRGYVSYVERRGIDPRFGHIPFVQVMGLSFPGCSGAGVYRYDGSCVGINRATVGIDAGTGIGLIIPRDTILSFLDGPAEPAPGVR